MTLFTKKSRNANRAYRKIKIPQCLLEAGIEKSYGLPNKGLIFPQFRTYPKFIEKFLRDNEIKNRWSWHNLRHKWTIEAAQRGMPLLMIMYNLGHSRSATTDGYLRSLSIPADYDEIPINFLGDDSSATSANSAMSHDF